MVPVHAPNSSKKETFNAFKVKPYNRAMSVNGKHLQTNNDKLSQDLSYLSDIVFFKDLRSWKLTKVKVKERQELINQECWKVVHTQYVSKNSNTLSTRFVLSIEDEVASKKV